MASMAVHLKPKLRPPFSPNPSFSHLFSSSSNPNPNPNPNHNPTESQSEPQSQSKPQSRSPVSSYFSDVKSSLKQQQNQQPAYPRRSQQPQTTPFSSPQPSKVASLEEIRKNLSEFRHRTAVPPPESKSKPISFQELYKRNVIDKGGEDPVTKPAGGNKLSLEAIRESLKQLRSNSANSVSSIDRGGGNVPESLSLARFKDSLKLRPADMSSGSVVLGGSEAALPTGVFGKEINEREERKAVTMKTEFVKMYTYGELGEKLRKLRPVGVGEKENWFSLEELNERLMKLREEEEKETESRIGGVLFKDLRDSLRNLKMIDDAKSKRTTAHRIDILGQLGGTPSFMLAPPKEHLVEKYFHPDNMSSAEKMKLQLKNVRDEFKMSESDCGSARIQVAQLTTKIKHLSSALHKKDKHSRKGLIAMVQRRKKLLRYLRRTDWESYSFVLSKLGLRDNPDTKIRN